jgi:methylated-DNA-[protein]-cysteine S-methyltransferase
VWSILEEIPYGETTTYGEIAARLGAQAQTVGKAVGQNPLSIIIPCHRVVGKNGSLTGYAGGLKRKQFLLKLEEPVGARLF